MLELIGQTVPATTEAAPSSWVPMMGAILAFIGGVTLWLAGRHVLRPGFVFIGTFIGAVVGVLGSSALDSGLDPIVLGTFGLITGGILGWLLFRAAVALSMGLILGVATTVITASTVAFQEPHAEPPATESTAESSDGAGVNEGVEADESSRTDELRDLLDDWWDRIPEATLDPPPPEPESIAERTDQAAEELDLLARTSAFASGLAHDIEPIWQRTTPAERWLTLGSALVGFGLGLVVGVAAPKRAAGAVTAFTGPAIWIPSAALILLQLDIGAEAIMPQRPLQWMGMWAGAVIIGLATQWTRARPNADKG